MDIDDAVEASRNRSLRAQEIQDDVLSKVTEQNERDYRNYPETLYTELTEDEISELAWHTLHEPTNTKDFIFDILIPRVALREAKSELADHIS